jgi:hypothetical protein
MMTGERIRFLVIMSVEMEKIKAASDFVAQELTRQFGGVTVLSTSEELALAGYWADDGSAFKDFYSGNVVREPVIAVILSVLPEHEERAFEHIQRVIHEVVSEFDLKSRYIHVETTCSRARHFDVSEMR